MPSAKPAQAAKATAGASFFLTDDIERFPNQSNRHRPRSAPTRPATEMRITFSCFPVAVKVHW
ncbi:hypothetical protein GCM10027199_10780 [Amycolatopsis magusensis]